jgi:integrase
MGLRRGEIGGLLWSDIALEDDLDAGTLTIAHNRVSVGGQVHDTDPKTERSARTLPLTPADVLNASNPIELGEQVLPACAAFVFDPALVCTCKFACSTSRSTGTPQR